VGTEAGQPDFTCVYSDEQVPGYAVAPVCGTEACFCPRRAANRAQAHEWCSAKARINGSVVQVTGAFGLVLAGLVVQDVVRRTARADGQG
jgi:tRNA A37 threonylcarbamoyladenosine dehydratase